mmetsp:Transcript_50576/g.127039  ORF Transcript_50576/g.127039 Transcript_50576/m.127039 type:complete len:230 (+) Transcript_50576:264-953(+)
MESNIQVGIAQRWLHCSQEAILLLGQRNTEGTRGRHDLETTLQHLYQRFGEGITRGDKDINHLSQVHRTDENGLDTGSFLWRGDPLGNGLQTVHLVVAVVQQTEVKVETCTAPECSTSRAAAACQIAQHGHSEFHERIVHLDKVQQERDQARLHRLLLTLQVQQTQVEEDVKHLVLHLFHGLLLFLALDERKYKRNERLDEDSQRVEDRLLTHREVAHTSDDHTCNLHV